MNLELLRVVVISALLVLLATGGTGCAMDKREEQAPLPMASFAASTDWALLGNSPDMQHHSGLRQINTETVSDLGLAWAIDLPTRDGLIGNPLIKNGRIFQSGSESQVFANDLNDGEAALDVRAARRQATGLVSGNLDEEHESRGRALRRPRHRRNVRLSARRDRSGDRGQAMGGRNLRWRAGLHDHRCASRGRRQGLHRQFLR